MEVSPPGRGARRFVAELRPTRPQRRSTNDTKDTKRLLPDFAAPVGQSDHETQNPDAPSTAASLSLSFPFVSFVCFVVRFDGSQFRSKSNTCAFSVEASLISLSPDNAAASPPVSVSPLSVTSPSAT